MIEGGDRGEAWPHSGSFLAHGLSSCLYCGPESAGPSAQLPGITLPAGRAGSADGGPGQASLPALPKV